MNQRRLAAVAAALAVWGCLSGLVLIRLWAVLYGRLSGPVILVLAAALAGGASGAGLAAGPFTALAAPLRPELENRPAGGGGLSAGGRAGHQLRPVLCGRVHRRQLSPSDCCAQPEAAWCWPLWYWP